MSSSRSEHEALASAADGERGAFVVLWALLLVGLVTMMAIVVDLGHLREARATTQSAADVAALAAGEHLAAANMDPEAGCEDAARFIRMNIPDMPSGMTLPCGDLPPVCAADTPGVVVHDHGTAGRYRVEVTYPVPDSAILDERTSSGLRKDDGDQCERMGVSVRRTNDGFFTGVLGVNQLSTSGSAVVRRRPPESDRIPNLWLLDPTGCNVLSTQGGGSLRVGTLQKAGLITIDSDGSTCSGNSFTIDVGGSGRVRVLPVDMQFENNPNELDPHGEISLVAMWPGQTMCVTGSPGNRHACNPNQIGPSSNIWPQPTRRDRPATRAIVDHIYNCRSGQASPQYPDYPDKITVPKKIRVANCTDAEREPYVDRVREAIGSTGKPAGFQQWTAAGYSCSKPAVPEELPGNWWIDCAKFDLGGSTVNFTGGNIVFQGSLDTTSGVLRVNSGATEDDAVLDRQLPEQCLTSMTNGCAAHSSAEAAFVYFRNGEISLSSNPTLNFHRTAVIQDSGYVRLTAQNTITWNAPREGPFAGLSLWSEMHSKDYLISGGSKMNLEGVFFAPHANEFGLAGGGDMPAQQAQFIAYRLKIAGSGAFELVPSGLNAIELPQPVAALIR